MWQRMRFQGNIEAKLDRKNRVFVPAPFRRVLLAGCLETASETGEQGGLLLYVRKDVFQNCLVLYPEPVWENELTLLRGKLNKWDPQQQNEYRQFLLDAESVEMDASGRILLPKRLLEKVGITAETRFLGVDDTMEIWPKEALEKPLVEEEQFRQLIQDIMK